MFVKIVSFAEMRRQRRWKVEFFLSDNTSSRSAGFPLVSLRTLLLERKEFLDPQAFAECVFNYLGLEHVESLTGELIDSYLPRHGSQVLSRSKVFRRGDILYGRLRPALNKVFLANERLPEGICSGEFFVLIPNREKVLPHFARSLLVSDYIQSIVKGMTSGSALPRLQLDDLLDVEVPLPSLEKQQTFETIIIEREKHVRRLRTELDQAPGKFIEMLVNALEDGSTLDPVIPVYETITDFSDLRLPKLTSTSWRGRGRPRTRGSEQLTINLAE